MDTYTVVVGLMRAEVLRAMVSYDDAVGTGRMRCVCGHGGGGPEGCGDFVSTATPVEGEAGDSGAGGC